VSCIQIAGMGAVSPAGWGVAALREALATSRPIDFQSLKRPGWDRPLRVRQVPAPSTRPSFFAHPRLRRSSPVSQYSVAAALEAIGQDAARASAGDVRLGIIQCVMSGCVNYSRRFYDEVLRDPAIASPLLFPETVFNAPASHLGALLGTTAINYTLVGDPGTFLQGLALGANWLTEELVDACVIVGTEEMDWLTADAFRLFTRQVTVSEGAGALYLKRGKQSDRSTALGTVTDSHIFFDRATRRGAATRMVKQLAPDEGTLCDGLTGVASLDQAEAAAWAGWSRSRISPKKFLGEGLMAAAAWQAVIAADMVERGETSAGFVSVVGPNQQAVGARFERLNAVPRRSTKQ